MTILRMMMIMRMMMMVIRTQIYGWSADHVTGLIIETTWNQMDKTDRHSHLQYARATSIIIIQIWLLYVDVCVQQTGVLSLSHPQLRLICYQRKGVETKASWWQPSLMMMMMIIKTGLKVYLNNFKQIIYQLPEQNIYPQILQQTTRLYFS